MTTQGDVASKIVATLGITEPDLDTSVGSVTRKIIDAVAQQIADSYVDGHLLTYQYDIDSKVEADLDDFVQLFGISRIAAKRATGVVTFQRGAGDKSREAVIPVNTQIASASSVGDRIVTVQTVTPGFMPPNVTTVEVPVIAVEPGVIGNVGAGLLTRFRTPLEGVLAVTNVQALTGGIGQETDAELRARWKRTVFRSLAGTEAMYVGIALNHDNCFGANVLGATKIHSEQVQIGDDKTGISSLDDVHFAYGETAILGANLAGSNVLQRGYDFELDTTVRPIKVKMLTDVYATGQKREDGTLLKASVIGAVFDLVYEYAPDSSRNLPSQGITNRVDVWCAGERAESAVQSVVFSNTRRFVTDYGSPYYAYNYVRPDQSSPKPGNVFIPLAFGPILTLPTSLVINKTTYKIHEHYHLVHDNTSEGWTATSRFGIEWEQAHLPAGLNPVFIVGESVTESGVEVNGYTYNAMVSEIQQSIERWRLVGMDAKAHQARLQQLRFNIAVMYDRGTSAEIVNDNIETALKQYLRGLSFGATVQISDALQAIHNAAGVDNVRFLDSRDWKGYNPNTPNKFGVGIQRVVYEADGTARVVQSFVRGLYGEPYDVTFGDSEIPVYESIRGDRVNPDTGETESGIPAVRAQNTFFQGIVTAPPPVQDSPGGGTPTPTPTTPGSVTGKSTSGKFTVTGTRTGGTVKLTWNALQGAQGYNIYDAPPGRINIEQHYRGSFGPANGTAVELEWTRITDDIRDYIVVPYTGHSGNAQTATFSPQADWSGPVTL